MNKKTLLIVVALAIALAVIIIYFSATHKEPAPAPSERADIPDAASVQNQLKERGEALFKQKRYAPIIEVYKRMLAKQPDNVELKKKLAATYTEAGQPDEAKKILEQIGKKVPVRGEPVEP